MQPGDGVAIYASPDRFSDLPFHLKKRVIIVGSDYGTLAEELDEPEHQEDLKHWFYSAGTFVHLFENKSKRFFFTVGRKKIT